MVSDHVPFRFEMAHWKMPSGDYVLLLSWEGHEDRKWFKI